VGDERLTVRRADFAGSWYPDDKKACRKAIEEFIEDAFVPKQKTGELVGGIVPHAGWMFSGRLACSVFLALSKKSKPDLVVIFGRHLSPFDTNYIMVEGELETPLGNIGVDEDFVQGLLGGFSFRKETPKKYTEDNTIELQLPFIKYFFPKAKIVTIGASPKPESLDIGKKTVEISRELGRKAVFIGSTDLTHYGFNYGFMPKGTGEEAVKWVNEVNDAQSVDLMVDMQPRELLDEALANHNACCMGAAATAIAACREAGAQKGELLSYYTSYDIHPGSSFVGYAGIIY
jgi:AmmeMemoRadiSam system protein B